jgi:hypothetical protein
VYQAGISITSWLHSESPPDDALHEIEDILCVI